MWAVDTNPNSWKHGLASSVTVSRAHLILRLTFMWLSGFLFTMQTRCPSLISVDALVSNTAAHSQHLDGVVSSSIYQADKSWSNRPRGCGEWDKPSVKTLASSSLPLITFSLHLECSTSRGGLKSHVRTFWGKAWEGVARWQKQRKRKGISNSMNTRYRFLGTLPGAGAWWLAVASVLGWWSQSLGWQEYDHVSFLAVSRPIDEH